MKTYAASAHLPPLDNHLLVGADQLGLALRHLHVELRLVSEESEQKIILMEVKTARNCFKRTYMPIDGYKKWTDNIK